MASRAGEICFMGREDDRWRVSSYQQIGRTGLRVGTKTEKKRVWRLFVGNSRKDKNRRSKKMESKEEEDERKTVQ